MKHIFLFLILFITAIIPTIAQEIQWQKVIGGDSTDYVWTMIPSADGGFLIGGNSMSGISGDKTLSNFGSRDFWIVKTDYHGNIQWQNEFGGTFDDDIYATIQTNDHGYILAGTSDSPLSGNKSQDSHGDDYWFVKIDSLGNKEWDKTIGGAMNDAFTSIAQTFDNGFIIGGFSASDSSYDKTENNLGGPDYWVVKTDSLLNIQWQRTLGSSFNDDLMSVRQTADSGYIIGGYSDSGSGSHGAFDYWVVKLDQFGNNMWDKFYGGTLDDKLSTIDQTSDGGFILGGISSSFASGDKSENSRGFTDFWIVKINSSGVLQWEKTIGGNWHESFLITKQTSDNGFLLGGVSDSPISGEKTEACVFPSDIWLVKTDSLGVIQWQNNIGAIRSEFLNAFCFTNDGILLGASSNSGINADKTEDSKGGMDFWLVKVTNEFNLIQGKVFLDLNSNSILDPGEHTLDNKIVHEINTNRIAFTQASGIYNVSTVDSGSYTVEPSSYNYCNVVPAQHSAYFSSTNQIDTANDFAFQPTGNINDLHVDISPAFSMRPGFDALYSVHYRNVGTTFLSASITLFPDANLTFNSATISPGVISTDSINWQISTLSPGDDGIIMVLFDISPSVSLGTLINSAAKIEPITNDADTSDNISDWSSIVVGSFDPNDITVSKSEIAVADLSSRPYLDYIIRFQNTGTDTAFNINISNQIPGMLDMQTFEFVESSHPVSIEYKNQEKTMWFHFSNIMLPDSNVDEHTSHGYLRYRLKPFDTLSVGDIIKNTAYIYFDYNFPVVTNTAQTQIVLHTNVSEWKIEFDDLVYPNPADHFAYVTGKHSGSLLIISDMLGKTVFQKNCSEDQIRIPVSSFAEGVYILKLQDKEGIYSDKLIIRH